MGYIGDIVVAGPDRGSYDGDMIVTRRDMTGWKTGHIGRQVVWLAGRVGRHLHISTDTLPE